MSDKESLAKRMFDAYRPRTAYRFSWNETSKPVQEAWLMIAGEALDEIKSAEVVERKRREECEAVLREVAGAPNRIAENARIIAAYFGEGN